MLADKLFFPLSILIVLCIVGNAHTMQRRAPRTNEKNKKMRKITLSRSHTRTTRMRRTSQYTNEK